MPGNPIDSALGAPSAAPNPIDAQLGGGAAPKSSSAPNPIDAAIQNPIDQNSDDEAQRMGEGQSWFTKPLTTSVLGLGEYRQGAGPIERAGEKFASGLLSPVSVGLMIATGGLGGIAEAGAATVGEEAVTSLSGRAGAEVLSRLAPETAANVAKYAGVVSKMANAGFTGQQILALADKEPQLIDAIKAGDSDKALELGTSMLLEGVAARLSTSHLMKTMSPTGEPVWTGDKDVIAESQQQERIAGAKALEFRKANEALIRNAPLDMAARFYHEAGEDPAKLEQWRQEIVDDNNIKPAIQQKYDAILKQAQNLPPEVKAVSSQLRLDYATDEAILKAVGKLHPQGGADNYAGQHTYERDDDVASSLRSVGMRRMTKSPGFTKARTFDTIVDALKAGYEPKEIGLAGAREQYIRDFGGMRGLINAEEEGMRQKTDDNRSLFIDPAKVRTIDGKRVIPLDSGREVGAVGERRADPETRKRIDQMSPDEMKRELLTSKVTGLPNRRAFDEADSPAVAMSDADGLKAFNDRFGYAAGDALLRAKAEALREAGVDAYHDKGDEFLYRGATPAELAQKLESARKILNSKIIDIDEDGAVRSFKGADFSYGAGKDTREAESGLKQHKSQREAAGERARGELRGITEVGPGQGSQNQSTASRLDHTEAVKHSVRPEDFLRRVGADKASILKEGADDLTVQNLRDAYKAGAKIEPIKLALDEAGNVLQDGTDGRHRALAAQQAGIEKIPIFIRRLTHDDPVTTVNKWPSGLNPVTDKEIIGRAIDEVTKSVRTPGPTAFDELDPKTQKQVIKRALDMKVSEKTKNSPDPTAVRKPSLSPSGTRIIAKNGRLYENVEDYKPGPDVFNRWRVRATDKYGEPIFERSNVLVHPDYHEAVTQAFEDSSWFRKNPLMRTLLGASTQTKKTLLSFSPFHFTTEYLRGIQMGLSPMEALRPRELTPDRLAIRAKFGPMFGVMSQRSLAAEGSASNTMLLHKLPLGVGKFLASNEERLFGGGGYIDRLKADSFDKVTDQIAKRHPNWSTDQVHFASSKIVDSAFGGLNWKMLGTSMNGIDALRLVALAPDFTGSQLLFAKHGLEPGGSVVGQSLMRIALYNFGVARVLNMLTSGGLQLNHPFSVVSPDGKKVYSIRTMPQDILHAMTDPRGFTYNRLNPLLIRTAVEGITGRDEQGKQVTYQKELHDLLRNILPISSQNLIPTFRREDEGVGTSVLRGLGVNAEPNTTSALKLSAQLASGKSESGPVDQDKLEHHQHVMQMEDALRTGAIKPEDLNDAIEHQTLSVDDAKKIWDNYKVTNGMDEFTARLYTRSDRLPMKDFLQVWDIATPTEKKVLLPLLEKKGKEYLKSAQKSMVQTQRDKDVTYLRVRRDLSHIPLW